jgi:hypothetical protein
MNQPIVWKTLKDLQEPFNDAVNYRTRPEKEFFNKIFLHTEELKSCLKPSVYFVLGEKGSGKTAYAAYLETNEIEATRCKLTTMTESQYKRFIALKREGKLSYSDYANIWRPMLLHMTCQTILDKSRTFFTKLTGKFSAIQTEINRFNKNALNPEVEVAFEAINEMALNITAEKKNTGKVSGDFRTKDTDKTSKIKHHLLETETTLKTAISDLKLGNNHIVFIDGIDYRPESVPYHDYLACIKGLGEAVWQLNNDFFGNIRDSKGRIKIVLLLRPDVFHALNLYNSNSRLQDNSVFLSWFTTEKEYRSSRLFEASGKYFSCQQTQQVSIKDAFDHYFQSNQNDQLFKRFLKNSFQKPRDILTFIRIARSLQIKRGQGHTTCIPTDIGHDAAFTNEYSDYLLGEVRNYSAFYMEQQDFSKYLKFFQFLDGRMEFSFIEFSKAFQLFISWTKGEKFFATEYLRDPEALLQFFYDVNLVGYKEQGETVGDKFFHWSFRERSLNNLSPKVKISGGLMINPGIAKAIDIGVPVKPRQEPNEPSRRQPSFGRSKGRRNR